MRADAANSWPTSNGERYKNGISRTRITTFHVPNIYLSIVEWNMTTVFLFSRFYSKVNIYISYISSSFFFVSLSVQTRVSFRRIQPSALNSLFCFFFFVFLCFGRFRFRMRFISKWWLLFTLKFKWNIFRMNCYWTKDQAIVCIMNAWFYFFFRIIDDWKTRIICVLVIMWQSEPIYILHGKDTKHVFALERFCWLHCTKNMCICRMFRMIFLVRQTKRKTRISSGASAGE